MVQRKDCVCRENCESAYGKEHDCPEKCDLYYPVSTIIKVLICGDRNWKNFGIIEAFILTLPKNTIIIEGDCRGADKIAGYLAEKHGLKVEKYPAYWQKYGNPAGPIRNQQMIDEGKPDIVIAFHNDLEHSKGTKDMVERAKKAGVKIQVISEDSWMCPACEEFHPKGSTCAAWEVRKLRDNTERFI